MAEVKETRAVGARAIRVPEFLREPLEAAQERLEHFEEEAQKLFKDLMDKGRASRKDLDKIVTRLSKQDWTFPELKQRLDRFREQGVERAAEWRGKADTWRTEALERLAVLQSRAVTFLGVATREQVEELSRELDRLAKRIEKAGPKARRNSKKGEV
jgi:chromosome segregation ATPase